MRRIGKLFATDNVGKNHSHEDAREQQGIALKATGRYLFGHIIDDDLTYSRRSAPCRRTEAAVGFFLYERRDDEVAYGLHTVGKHRCKPPQIRFEIARQTFRNILHRADRTVEVRD